MILYLTYDNKDYRRIIDSKGNIFWHIRVRRIHMKAITQFWQSFNSNEIEQNYLREKKLERICDE